MYDEVESSVAPSQIADSVIASTIGPPKSARSVAKTKFLDLIDQAKGLLGDLQEHEDGRESRAALFYDPSATENASAEVLNLDGHPQQLVAVAEASVEGRVIAQGRRASDRDLELLRENDEGFQDFHQRKETLISHVTHLARMRYEADPQKQQEVVAFAQNALREEEMAFAANRKQSIVSRRATQKSTVKDPRAPLSGEEIRSFAADVRQGKEEKDLGDLVGF